MITLARRIFSFYKSWKLKKIGDQPAWQRVPAGFEMLINPTEWLDQRMLFGVYEPWLLVFIQSVLQPGEIAVDIGTHKGYFTLHMAKQVGPAGKVFAFDPDPRVYDSLQRNCSRNGFPWVKCFHLALGEREGVIPFELNAKPGDSSRFHREHANCIGSA